jgi:hypothetical protein
MMNIQMMHIGSRMSLKVTITIWLFSYLYVLFYKFLLSMFSSKYCYVFVQVKYTGVENIIVEVTCLLILEMTMYQ